VAKGRGSGGLKGAAGRRNPRPFPAMQVSQQLSIAHAWLSLKYIYVQDCPCRISAWAQCRHQVNVAGRTRAEMGKFRLIRKIPRVSVMIEPSTPPPPEIEPGVNSQPTAEALSHQQCRVEQCRVERGGDRKAGKREVESTPGTGFRCCTASAQPGKPPGGDTDGGAWISQPAGLAPSGSSSPSQCFITSNASVICQHS